MSKEKDSKRAVYEDDEEVQHLVEKPHGLGELIKPHPVEVEEENISDMARIKQLASLSGPILSESLFYLLWQFITLIFLNQSTKVTVYAALGKNPSIYTIPIKLPLIRSVFSMARNDNIYCGRRLQRCSCQLLLSRIWKRQFEASGDNFS